MNNIFRIGDLEIEPTNDGKALVSVRSERLDGAFQFFLAPGMSINFYKDADPLKMKAIYLTKLFQNYRFRIFKKQEDHYSVLFNRQYGLWPLTITTSERIVCAREQLDGVFAYLEQNNSVKKWSWVFKQIVAFYILFLLGITTIAYLLK